MAFDPASPTLTLGVVGAGTMGRGIAQIAAAAGIEVRLYDARKGAAEEARGFIAKMLERQVEKGLAADARAHRAGADRGQRGSRAVRSGGRGDRRGFCRQTAPVRGPRADRATRYGAGDEHLVALGQRDRGGLQKAGAGGGLAFLQPGAADEGGRGDSRPAYRRARGGSAPGARPAHGPPSGARRPIRRAFWSTTPGAAMAPRRCASWPKASRARSRSTASCARRPAFAWGRSSSSTSSGSTSRMR